MLSTSDLPALNATLNSLCAVLLVCGYVFIRRRQMFEHKLCMLAASLTSVLFLTSYLIYHAQVGSKPFQGTGTIRVVYFTILLSHTVLAAAIVPMVIMTLRRGLRNDFDEHARIARRTFPLWLYVSITGVVIYWMLYQM